MFKLPLFNFRKRSKIKPNVLVVMDGYGIAPQSAGNAIAQAKKPFIDSLLATYPHTELIASGESVGLPANEVGNTEVGHLTLGAGRVIYQDLKRIDMQIENGGFFDNKAFLLAAANAKEKQSRLHIMGLVGSGNVHASLNHLFALLQFCKKENLDNVFLQLFLDGRDSPPKEGIEIVEKIENRLNALHIGRIASIAGRYYAMDRDRRWDRTDKAYKALVLGRAIQTTSARDAIYSAYARGQTDEFIEPTVIADADGPIGTIKDQDSVIFFNFRIDRTKQLTMAFVLPEFEKLKSFDFGYNTETSKEEGGVKFTQTFNREYAPKNLFFVTMTEYQKGLPVSAIAYGPEIVTNSLPFLLSHNNLKQMHMAESEKERFVTYYFRGMYEEKYPGEEVRIVPSPKVPTYDKKPEMSLAQLVNAFKDEIKKDNYHFYVLNFANADMVAHTGNLKASITAIECIDKHLKTVVDAVLDRDGSVFITADHGNAEELITYPTTSFFVTSSEGTVNTDHSNNPVPLIVVNKRFAGGGKPLPKGVLGDVAPTILSIIGIPVPPEMTGKNLLQGTSLLLNTNSI